MHDSRGRRILEVVALRCVALPIFSQTAAVRFSTSDSGRRRSMTSRKKVGKLHFFFLTLKITSRKGVWSDGVNTGVLFIAVLILKHPPPPPSARLKITALPFGI